MANSELSDESKSPCIGFGVVDDGMLGFMVVKGLFDDDDVGWRISSKKFAENKNTKNKISCLPGKHKQYTCNKQTTRLPSEIFEVSVVKFSCALRRCVD